MVLLLNDTVIKSFKSILGLQLRTIYGEIYYKKAQKKN